VGMKINVYRILVGKIMKVRDHHEVLSMLGRIILKCISKK
jgi:hypothetical protein